MNADEFKRLILVCPQCRAKCQFRMIWNSGGGAVLVQIHGHITRYVLQCTACQDFLFLRTRRVTEAFPTEPNIADQFPPAGINPDPSIPLAVRVDFREASICLSAGAWNAGAALCRRALQSCAKDKGADPKDDLFDQLKELRDKSIIQGVLYDMADAIRSKGNIGAHPGRDPIVNEKVSEAEARAVFALVEQVFKYVYEFPAQIGTLKNL